MNANTAFIVLILLLSTSRASAIQVCNSSKIASSIQRLNQLDQEELESIAKCDGAIPFLIKEIENFNSGVIPRAAYVLYLMGSSAKSASPTLIQLSLNQEYVLDARTKAIQALGTIRPQDRETVSALLFLLQQEKSIDIRRAAAASLATNSQGEREILDALFNIAVDNSEKDSVRSASAYAVGDLAQSYPGTIDQSFSQPLIEVIIDSRQSDQVVAACIYALGQLNVTDKKLIDALTQVIERKNERVQSLSATAVADIAEQIYNQSTTSQDIDAYLPTVQDIYSKVSILDNRSNPDIQEAQQKLGSTIANFKLKKQTLLMGEIQKWILGERSFWIIHPLFWIALIFAYPKSSKVQAFFFWNKYIREFFGLWYVSALLTWIPPLRCRLFAPFKGSLLADAKLDSFDPQAFFSQSGVRLKDADAVQLIQQILPEIKGQIILEGESGLGKTMMLRHLVRQSKRITVYLPAQKCENGVIEAIQAKLHGQAQDEDFLKKLIYSGAIDICIDGLNEVKPDVRANIKAFVESYFKGNIIMTTQPLLWHPPSTAKTYVLQPLHRNQIEQFLHLCEHRLPSDAKLHGTNYRKACTQFLADALSDQSASDDPLATRRILSNPMDLTIVAQMIGSGVQPDLFHLQEQQHKLMAEDYEHSWNQPFPLKQFSEFVYQMRDKDEYAMTGESFYQALTIMEKERHRMVLSRQWKDKDGNDKQEWSFRHDKIMEFFIVQNFMSSGNEGVEKRKKHMGDPRFRGIYLLLARLLPLNDALKLRENLIQYAADTQDHTVSDAYIQLMRSRC